MNAKDKSKTHLVRKGPSRIHGTGVFARRTIPKNTRILHYNGEKIPVEECRRREKRHIKEGTLWIFEINRRWFVDASMGGGTAKYVNHSKQPNCWIDIRKGEIWYCASKTLLPGQELTIDYGTKLPPPS